MREIIADDRLEGDLDAKVVEAVGEIEGVRVLAERCEHFRASGDDFSDHVFFCEPFLVRGAVSDLRRRVPILIADGLHQVFVSNKRYRTPSGVA